MDFWNRNYDFGTTTLQFSDTWDSGNQSFDSDTGHTCHGICLNCLSAICHDLSIESGFLPVKKLSEEIIRHDRFQMALSAGNEWGCCGVRKLQREMH